MSTTGHGLSAADPAENREAVAQTDAVPPAGEDIHLPGGSPLPLIVAIGDDATGDRYNDLVGLVGRSASSSSSSRLASGFAMSDATSKSCPKSTTTRPLRESE